MNIDDRRILVMSKGGRERWMHLGDVGVEALWEYMQLRSQRARWTDALWVDSEGKAMLPDWLRLRLNKLGERVGVLGLHPHRFRHTFAMN